nr:52 kDa repressor of the inhibitor of the protein kinase-like [Onthophagus taurus]
MLVPSSTEKEFDTTSNDAEKITGNIENSNSRKYATSEELEDGSDKEIDTDDVEIQNKLIKLCGNAVKSLILKAAKKSFTYSILEDDISGSEQLSLELRFFDEENLTVREEFLGFEKLESMDARTIAETINNFLQTGELDPQKCVGQGYNGCAAMAGKDGGVQKIIREKYRKGLFFHCHYDAIMKDLFASANRIAEEIQIELFIHPE